MIEFFINGNKVDVTFEGEKTIGDVLKSFAKTCEDNFAAVIGIFVNGKQITADIFDEEALKPLEENTKFEFTIVTKDTIKDSFANLSVLFDQLAAKMEQVPVDLQNGKVAEVSESIKTLADSINEFCHIATLATLFPDTFSEKTINNMNFKDFFADFSPILSDFEQALQNNDSVMIGDLSEYEICPRLHAIADSLKNQ